MRGQCRDSWGKFTLELVDCALLPANDLLLFLHDFLEANNDLVKVFEGDVS